MTRPESRFLRAAHWAVALSGAAWAWLIFFAPAQDPYSAVGSPWRPRLQTAHLLAAPALILAIGLIWNSHAWARIRSGFTSRRRSGILLALLFLPMAASGYLLQISVEEWARSFWSWCHVGASLAWIAAWLLHRCARPAAEVRAA